jgi:hypothetical protein
MSRQCLKTSIAQRKYVMTSNTISYFKIRYTHSFCLTLPTVRVMKLKTIQFAVLFAVLVGMVLFACTKNSVLSTGGILKFSTDTLAFDTVFTTQGSYTNGLLIYNPQDNPINISSVRLAGGANSYFRLNVDGYSGNNIQNLKIAPHDSMYVFATVNINPNDSLTPFFITDKLIATLNGKDFTVPFTAFGQNAHFLVSDSISSNLTWLTDKPYVVIHSLVVGPGGTLNIPPKCRVYLHQDARIFVFGSLNVGKGSTGNDSVVLQGDRLDRAYFGYLGYPGEWGGIYLVTGSTGYIDRAIIKNCGGSTSYYNFQTQSAAIEVDSGASLTMNHSIIKNSIGYGLLNYQGTSIVNNSLINTTGAEALLVLQGGNVTATNCTFANYGSYAVAHSNNGTVTLINYLPIGNGQYIPGKLTANLVNCIVYGSLDSEIICDSAKGATATAELVNCLMKTGSVFEQFVLLKNCIQNHDPMFKDAVNGDFHLTSGSPAIGKGAIALYITDDIDEYARPSGYPDIGCYQYH